MDLINGTCGLPSLSFLSSPPRRNDARQSQRCWNSNSLQASDDSTTRPEDRSRTARLRSDSAPNNDGNSLRSTTSENSVRGHMMFTFLVI